MRSANASLRDFEALLQEMIGLSSASVGTSVIRHALARRMAACALPDLHAYWAYLQEHRDERQELIDCVVVPETWFFRDAEAFGAMTGHLRARASAGRPFRLLSLPCSTGEEPYSIAMALFDAGFAAADFSVEAVDVSARNLAYAERAIYGRNSFRGADLAFRARHFAAADGGFRPHERIRRQVRFTLGNLLGPSAFAAGRGFDVVFCRNLLIYFDRPTQAEALVRLGGLLAGDGLLLVGPGESGLPSLHGYASVRRPRAFGFVKAGAAPALSGKPERAASRRAPRSSPAAPREGRGEAAPARPFSRRIAPAETAAPAPEAAKADLAAARGEADAGRFAEARSVAERHVAEHGPSAEAFYLIGLTYDAEDDEARAGGYYRKALYLAPGHREALAHLRLLLQRQGDEAAALVLARRLGRLGEGGDA
ncbi:CheR family methyltransferase [Bosea sp. (in: a-proteobacteria)]